MKLEINLLLSTSIYSIIVNQVMAIVRCNTTVDCQGKLRDGTICKSGFCTNPFASGCLRRYLGEDVLRKYGFPELRTCNSQDEINAEEKGICRSSELDYMEISVAPANWESSMFYGWVMQIILSELLDVPTKIETNASDKFLNFYNISNPFNFPNGANNFDGLQVANEVGDCRKTTKSCAHALPELWQANRNIDENQIERDGNGEVGFVGWFLPKYAVEMDPSLVSYFGLAGEKNRKKLAETFKRPMTWGDYCSNISFTNCTDSKENNATALRPPNTTSERNMYYMTKGYNGYFIATDKNNCTLTENCTGHIIDYPCKWSAYTHSQLYWNNISLEIDVSYSYSEIKQIMKAGRATNSPYMAVWWYPEPTLDEEDLVSVQLPPATNECLDNRPEPKPDRCGASFSDLIGKEVGSCGYNAHSFEKIYPSNLREQILSIPLAQRSPAYSALHNIRITDVEMTEMLNDYHSREIDSGYDAREAVCSWVAESFRNSISKRSVKRFIPPGYPRTFKKEEISGPLFYGAIFFTVIVIFFICLAFAATEIYKTTKVIRYAQKDFLYLFCLGYLFVCIGAILNVMKPTDASCTAREWFVLLGYTLGLVPILMKIAAINNLMNNARKFKRVQIGKKQLFSGVAIVNLVVVIFLTVWTAVDPPKSKTMTDLDSETSGVIVTTYQCRSKTNVWRILSFLIMGTLIFSSAILAFQSRKMKGGFNESREIGNMAYSHFIFLLQRLLLWSIPNDVIAAITKQGIGTFLLGFDSLLAICLYFIPKVLIARDKKNEGSQRRVSTGDTTAIESAASKVSNFRHSAPFNVTTPAPKVSNFRNSTPY